MTFVNLNQSILTGMTNLVGATVSAQNGSESGFIVKDAGNNRVFSVGDGSALIRALWGFDSTNYIRGNYFSINRGPNTLKSLDFQSNVSNRWRLVAVEDSNDANLYLQRHDLAGSFLANTLSFNRSNGFVGVGAGASSPVSLLHLDSGSTVATTQKYSNSNTGNTVTDGFDVGITANGTASLWQRENLSLDFYTNNTLRMSLGANGNLGLANGITIGGGNVLNRVSATFSGGLAPQTINPGQTITVSGITVTGAAVGNSDIAVIGGYSIDLPDGIIPRAVSSGPNLMDAKFTNATASAIVISSPIQFRIGYMKF